MNEDADLINTPLQWGDLPSEWRANRFSGFRRPAKTAKAVRVILRPLATPLKWGVNETCPPIIHALVKFAG